MKKILTVAIAAAIAAPMASSAADTVLYGKINNSLIHKDSTSQWDVVDNSSRIGVKASEDLGNGMKAVLQMEWDADTAEGGSTQSGSLSLNNRLAYVGIAGGFGTVAIGRQWGPYYGAVDKTDIFSVGGTTGNSHYMGGFRTGNALAYVSPNFSGITVKLAAVMDAETAAVAFAQDTATTAEVAEVAGANAQDGVDTWNGSISYDNAGLSIGLGFVEDENSSTADLIGLGVKYAMGDFAVMAQYERQDNATDDSEWAIGGTAAFGNNVAKLVYGSKDVAGADNSGWGLGLDHNFTKRTKVFVEYHDSEIGGDEQTFGMGVQHAF